jgi:hypothetical protein
LHLQWHSSKRIHHGEPSSEIIVGDLASDAAQGNEGVHVTADESFKALAMSELQTEHAAVGFDEGERVELALVAAVVEHAEMKKDSKAPEVDHSDEMRCSSSFAR